MVIMKKIKSHSEIIEHYINRPKRNYSENESVTDVELQNWWQKELELLEKYDKIANIHYYELSK